MLLNFTPFYALFLEIEFCGKTKEIQKTSFRKHFSVFWFQNYLSDS